MSVPSAKKAELGSGTATRMGSLEVIAATRSTKRSEHRPHRLLADAKRDRQLTQALARSQGADHCLLLGRQFASPGSIPWRHGHITPRWKVRERSMGRDAGEGVLHTRAPPWARNQHQIQMPVGPRLRAPPVRA